MNLDPNMPAFPEPMARDSEGVNHFVTDYGTFGGMTYRQWLVGTIAQGMAAGAYWGENVSQHNDEHRNAFALTALAQADAIIAALNAEDGK